MLNQNVYDSDVSMYMFALLDPWPFWALVFLEIYKNLPYFFKYILKGLACGLMAESFQACCDNKVFCGHGCFIKVSKNRVSRGLPPVLYTIGL